MIQYNVAGGKMNRGLTVLAVQTTFSKAEGRPLTDKVFPSCRNHFFPLKFPYILLCVYVIACIPYSSIKKISFFFYFDSVPFLDVFLSLNLFLFLSLPLSFSTSFFLYLHVQERCQSAALGWCVEFLQAFFLVADDAMDDSVTRRGHPCWFRLPEVKLVKNKYKIKKILQNIFLRSEYQKIVPNDCRNYNRKSFFMFACIITFSSTQAFYSWIKFYIFVLNFI